MAKDLSQDDFLVIDVSITLANKAIAITRLSTITNLYEYEIETEGNFKLRKMPKVNAVGITKTYSPML